MISVKLVKSSFSYYELLSLVFSVRHMAVEGDEATNIGEGIQRYDKTERNKMTTPFDSEPNLDGFNDRQSSIRANHPHQAVFGHTIINEGGITYDGAESLWTIPKWLSKSSPVRFDEKHRDTSEVAKKTPDTWKWLLNYPEFKSWRDWRAGSEDEEPRRLLCSGILGAGKTVLASIVIEDLRSKLRPSDSICLFMYFEFKDRQQYLLRNLYSSLLAQLVQRRSTFTEEAQKAFEAWKLTDMYPSMDEYLKILIAEIRTLSSVYIVIDALDECPNDIQNRTRSELLKSLRSFPSNTHILFTTRQHLDIKREVQEHGHIDVLAKPEDLQKYLHNRVADRDDLQLVFSKQRSQENIFSHIVERSKGMFLLAQLHIDFLLMMPPSEIEDGVRALPETPDDVYKRTLERISLLDPPKKALALRCLKWLVLVERPLKIQELLHAVSIKIGDSDIRDGISVTEENVTAVCAGIVVVDPGTRIVRLAHYTATSYLERTDILDLNPFHSEIAEICLTYLSFIKTRSTSQYDNEVQDRRKKYPFLNYAADYWGHHVSQSTRGQVRRKACEFLEDGVKLASALQAMSEPRFRMEKRVTGLHMAAYFNLSRLAKDMIEKKRRFALNAQTSNGETAVHWAAFYGHARVLGVLIEKGADLDTKDNSGRTALHKATMNDDHVSVKMMLESKRVDTQTEDVHGWTSLRWAASNGQETLVRMLLENNDKIDAQDKDGWTALRWAAHKGNDKIVELLIEKRASLQSTSKDGWTVLLWASREGKHKFISFLAKKGVPLDDVDCNGETALKEAIRYGHGKTVFALLEAKANVNLADTIKKTPLHVAVEVWKECGNKTIVWLLLESGADINAQTKHGYTPLHLAAMKGHNLVIWLLLQKGADPRLKDNAGQTALHLAVVEGHEEVVPSLLLWDARLVDIRNDESRTALHEAASSGNVKLVAALLHGRSRLESQDRQGCTALHRAVIQQHEDVVLFLISKHANVNLANRKKNTALHEAAISGNKVIIEALLRKGLADAALINSEGLTPWEVARQYGHDIQKF
ncbi:hypothetical protein GQX73_g9554 [Xylaria multiplex]|uniref:NACHT domain-containing protein n=1 Tax=Xylaria multiplex TaxID=323545 RepID=A0A7C8N162_9PEZI|nr:hypothetical protein GQX73_g9554 [Xylaria multiplex]